MQWSESGASLVETLVGMVVFAIAAAATTSLMFNSTTHVADNNQSSVSIVLAQSTLEDLRMLAYQDIESGSNVFVNDAGTLFTIHWNVFDDDPGPGMKAIVVTVTWDSQGETHIYETESIFSQVTA